MQDALRIQRDGMHDVVETPEFQSALDRAVSNYFGANAPGLLELLRRFLMPGDRNDARSYDVGSEPAASGAPGRVQVLERNPARVQALIMNNGSAVVYVGGKGVTVGGLNDASGGVPIQPGTGVVFKGTIGELYAISGSPHQDVRVLDIFGGI